MRPTIIFTNFSDDFKALNLSVLMGWWVLLLLMINFFILQKTETSVISEPYIKEHIDNVFDL